MPDWEAVKREYLSSDISLRKLAGQYGIKYNTMKHHASRNKWSDERKAGIKPKPVTEITAGAKDINEYQLEIMSECGLTDREKRFLAFYVNVSNASEAYRQAFKKSDNASKKAYQLKNTPRVAKAYSQIMDKRAEYLTADLSRIMDRAKQVSEASIRDFLDWTSQEVQILDDHGKPVIDPDGKPRVYYHNEVKLKPRDAVDFYPIEAVTQNNRGDVTIKLSDRNKASELLMKLNRQAIDARLQLAKVKKMEAEAKLAETQAEAVRVDHKPKIQFVSDWDASGTADELTDELKKLRAENAELKARLNSKDS